MRPEIQAVLRDTPVLCIELSAEDRLKMCDALWSDKFNEEKSPSQKWISDWERVRDRILEDLRPERGSAGSVRREFENRELVLLRDVLREAGFVSLREEILKAARPLENMGDKSKRPGSDVRKAVVDDYDGECVACGMTKAEHIDRHDTRLKTYHVVDFERFNTAEDAHRLDNMILLCDDCREAVDGEEEDGNEPPESDGAQQRESYKLLGK